MFQYGTWWYNLHYFEYNLYTYFANVHIEPPAVIYGRILAVGLHVLKHCACTRSL